MALTGNEYIIRGGAIIVGVDNLTTNPGKYLSLDSDNKMSYRTGAEVLSDISDDLTEGYIPIKNASTLVDSNIYRVSNKIGVNVTNPDGTFHVMSGSAGVVTAYSAGNDLVVENYDDGGISIIVPDTNIGGIYFANPGNVVASIMTWDNPNKLFRFGTNIANGVTQILSGEGDPAFSLDATQDVTFKGANYQFPGVLQTDANGKSSVNNFGADDTKFLNNLGQWAVPPGTGGTTGHPFTITIETGTTEGTDKFTFDGSADKLIDFQEGDNINLDVSTPGIVVVTGLHTASMHDGLNIILYQSTVLSSGLESTDELLVNDGGTVKRMDVSVVQDYMQDNLLFVSKNAIGNYDLTITAKKTVAANTWATIDFELPAVLEQNVNGEYDDNTSLFTIADGDTWLFNLTVSLGPTVDGQYIEVQMYNNDSARPIAVGSLIANGTTLYQSVSLTGIMYGDGTSVPIIFRAKSNQQFDIRPDTNLDTFKGTCLVATKRNTI